MNSYLFFYLFYNIHNGQFLNRLKYKWISQKYIYIGEEYYRTIKIDNIFNPQSMLELAENAEYFSEHNGYNKELNLFEPQYFQRSGESLYSKNLDFICMAYAKKTMQEVFTVDNSYEKLFALVAMKYADHTKIDKIKFIEWERCGIRSKPHGRISNEDTNNSLGYFSNVILENIQDRYIPKRHYFINHNEIYDYFLNRWKYNSKWQDNSNSITLPSDIPSNWHDIMSNWHDNRNSITRYELLIAKKIVDDQLITTTNFLDVTKNGFEINREISSLIKKLKKLKKFKKMKKIEKYEE
jgi:hypothetical protein